MIKEKAYAKINLALEVMDEKDGYHMVNNLMMPIDIYDELEFEKDNNIIRQYKDDLHTAWISENADNVISEYGNLITNLDAAYEDLKEYQKKIDHVVHDIITADSSISIG